MLRLHALLIWFLYQDQILFINLFDNSPQFSLKLFFVLYSTVFVYLIWLGNLFQNYFTLWLFLIWQGNLFHEYSIHISKNIRYVGRQYVCLPQLKILLIILKVSDYFSFFFLVKPWLVREVKMATVVEGN